MDLLMEMKRNEFLDQAEDYLNRRSHDNSDEKQQNYRMRSISI